MQGRAFCNDIYTDVQRTRRKEVGEYLGEEHPKSTVNALGASGAMKGDRGQKCWQAGSVQW